MPYANLGFTIFLPLQILFNILIKNNSFFLFFYGILLVNNFFKIQEAYMKKFLSLKESILIGSMLFGMFFGAGNLIFPIHLGQLSGSNILPASIGFILTAAGLPLLGVASIGISKKNDLLELSSLVGEKYKYFFTIALYLTIGPFFAIPRCATTSFTIGIQPMIESNNIFLSQLIFTFIFFAIVLLFSLKPNKIMDWIGKYINPAFLFFLLFLIIRFLISPMGNFKSINPEASFQTAPFFKGFLEGYNTMDAIASLAFGITVIEVIRSLKITDTKYIALNTILSGVISCVFMGLIYTATIIIGASSRNVFSITENGGIALSQISNFYFSNTGRLFLFFIVTLACLKTSIGLVVSCSEMFYKLFPKFISIKKWVWIFTLFSFFISNFGLTSIIQYSIPVLMFLYPLTISLILLALFGKFFNYEKPVFVFVTILNLLAAFLDFLVALPGNLVSPIFISNLKTFLNQHLLFFDIGLGWVCPSLIGLVIGLIFIRIKKH